VSNGRPGVDGKGKAPLWVKTEDRTPQANATFLQGFLERQITQHLLAHDSLHKTVVARHQLAETPTATSLRLDERGGSGASTPRPLFV
jgi:hypothetical protein